jgi:dihydropteroate synthase
VIRAIKRELALPVSVDTFKPEVARAAVDAGADIINSIDGFRNPELRRVAADTGAAIVIMHIQGEPRVANPTPHYHDVVEDVRCFLQDRVRDCLENGIDADRIVIDPGPGFGKTSEHDIELLRKIERFTALPFPVLLAASRKRFIGDVLGLDAQERLEGSLAVIAWSVLHGVKLVRVHDVKASRRVCRMTEAVLHPERVQEVRA